MRPINDAIKNDKETEYLSRYLGGTASEINERFGSFHASVSRGGAIPQLRIRKKRS